MSQKCWDQSDHRLLWHYIENFLTRFTTRPCLVTYGFSAQRPLSLTFDWPDGPTFVSSDWFDCSDGLTFTSDRFDWSDGPKFGSMLSLSLRLSFTISRSCMRGTERTYLPPLAILTSTVRTTASLPGNTCVTMPSGHFKRGWLTSCTKTTDPILTSQRPVVPFQGGRLRI